MIDHYIAIMRYQLFRSVSDHHVFVLCRDGEFYEAVPEDVRRLGPWQGSTGDVEALRPEYRAALVRDGYAVIRTPKAVFNPEI